MTSGPHADAAKHNEKCPTCQGSGKLRAQSGAFVMERVCTACGGTGSSGKSNA